MSEQMIRQIPYGKAARVGNYKLWRGKYTLTIEPTDEQRKKVREESKGKKRAVNRNEVIDCIYVSNTDGSWMTKIPQTVGMYGTITYAYADEDHKRGEDFLTMIFGNMMSIALINNEYLHDAFNFLQNMMATPYLLLPEEVMVERMKMRHKAEKTDRKTAKEQIEKSKEYHEKIYDLISKKITAFVEDYEQELDARKHKEADAEKALDRDEIADIALDITSKPDGEEEVQ